MFISDKVSSMTKLQPNTVIRAAPRPVERGRRRRSDDTQTGGTVGGSAAGALLALQEQAGAARRTGRSHAGGESYAFGAESRRRLALFRSGMPAASGRRCSPTAMARASMPARDRAHRRWKRPTRSFALLRGGFFGRGRRQCADDNQLLHCWGRA